MTIASSGSQPQGSRSTLGREEAERLLSFARRARINDGFGSLNRHGHVDATLPTDAIITARMTHVFSIASLYDRTAFATLAAHGVSSLANRFRDQRHGGYLSALSGDGVGMKLAYVHDFVLLAASTAKIAGIPGATELLDDVATTIDLHFWSESDGAMRDRFDRSFSVQAPYWGANSNMHAVEAFLAAWSATRSHHWLQRAERIAERFTTYARANHWLLPEHYHADWSIAYEFNRDRPSDEFRPFGVTVGHLFEWSRLLVELGSAQRQPLDWVTAASVSLYTAAHDVGWKLTPPGIIYTVDWSGNPVIAKRPHWAIAEAIAAAGTLMNSVANPTYLDDLQTWSRCVDKYFIDRTHGSWFHLLDETNYPSFSMWTGKPDVYHAFQACLIPHLPVRPCIAERLLAYRPTSSAGGCKKAFGTR